MSYAVPNKNFVALLRSISRALLEGEKITEREDLKSQLFQQTDISPERQEHILVSLAQIIEEAARKNQQPAQLKDTLQERNEFSEEQIQLFVQFWTNEGPKHHFQKIKHATFGRQLVQNGLKWRVDQVTNVKNLSEISQTVAVVELVTKETNGSGRKVSFEVGRDTLNQVLEQLNQVQKRIDNLSV
jgi:hypothetical protein